MMFHVCRIHSANDGTIMTTFADVAGANHWATQLRTYFPLSKVWIEFR